MIEELSKIGLTENESKVYTTILEKGSCTAGEIIKETHLHRNIVYENLDRLIEKGLVSFVIIKNIKNFQVTGVEELKNYVKKKKQEALEKEKTLNNVIPKIKSLKKEKSLQEATILRGKKSLKFVLEEMANSKTEILVFGTGWGMKETMKTYYNQWHLKLSKNKIKARIVLPSNKKGEYLKPFKTRYLEEEEMIPSTIAIYEDKVLNVVWKDQLGFLIVSKDLADSYRRYFEYLWKGARKK